MLKGIGIGSVITVKLAGDISPMITDFLNEDENIKPFELPKKCPFCNTKTVLRKGKTPTLSCPNVNCHEVLKQKMINFLKVMKIKGVAEGKLDKLPQISLEAVCDNYFPDDFLTELIAHTDTKTFLVALGIGGAQAVDKLIKANDVNGLETITNNFDEIYKLIEKYLETDPFIAEVMDYISTLL